MRVLILFSLLIVIFTSCKKSKVENLLSRMWIVKSMTYNGNQSRYGSEILDVNTMSFDIDATCQMPFLRTGGLTTEGQWSIFEKEKIFYLKVFNCSESFFNDTYELKMKNHQLTQEIILISTTRKLLMQCFGVETL